MPAARVGSVRRHIVKSNDRSSRRKGYSVDRLLISVIEGLEVARWLIWLELTFFNDSVPGVPMMPFQILFESSAEMFLCP